MFWDCTEASQANRTERRDENQAKGLERKRLACTRGAQNLDSNRHGCAPVYG